MSTPLNRDRIKDNIRKMLNLAANHAAADGEIANALAMAERWMAQHHISEEELEQGEEVQFDPASATFDRGNVQTTAIKIKVWEGQLANWVCEFVGGVKVYNNTRERIRKTDKNGLPSFSKKGKRPLYTAVYTFYGVAEDVEIATQVYNECHMAILAMAELSIGSPFRVEGRNYCEGFVLGLYDQLGTIRNEQKQLAHQQSTSGNSTALVAVQKRNEIVQLKQKAATDWLAASQGIKLQKARITRSHRQSAPDARSQGRTDGQKYSADGARRKKLT